MGLVKSLWVVGGENSSHRGEEWAKLYARRRYDTSLRTDRLYQGLCHPCKIFHRRAHIACKLLANMGLFAISEMRRLDFSDWGGQE